MGQPAPAAATARLDVWRDLIREHFVALDIDAPDDGFAGAVRSSGVGHLKVASVTSRTQQCRRTTGLARRDDTTYLQVGLLARGSAQVSQDGRTAWLRPGQFAVYETGRPFVWGLRGDWELLVLTWPRAGVGVDPATSSRLTARALGGPGLGGMVGRMLRDVVTEPPELSPAGGVRLADELAELVTTVAAEVAGGPGPAAEGRRAADDLVRRAEAYIAEHLADPELGPTTVAAAHFVSTRHLHRLFAERDATVTRYIQRLRLDRCRRELLDPASAGRPVSEIARRWGFTDPTSFSRAFRAEYGIPPSEYRVLALSDGA